MTVSQYSISIAQEVSTVFNGFFNVDNTTNLVVGFYETIDGSTNFNNNILIPTGTGEYAGEYVVDNTYEFKVYVINGFAGYDNAYLPTWFQFDPNGVIINSMSTFPQSNQFNFYSANNESINNLGVIKIVYTSGETAFIDATFTINPVLVPVVPCFKEGTKILTDKGYIPIENLRKGDLVKTLNHDFLSIDMIGFREIYHAASEERIKDQLYKCSKEEFEEIVDEPLILTGCHSILVDSFTSEEQRVKMVEVNGGTYITDKKYRLPACVDERTSVYEIPGNYTIYHLALENDDYYMNYGIYANGLLVETCSKRYLKELSNMTLIQ